MLLNTLQQREIIHKENRSKISNRAPSPAHSWRQWGCFCRYWASHEPSKPVWYVISETEFCLNNFNLQTEKKSLKPMMCGYKASFLSSTNTYPTVNSWRRSADYMTRCGDTLIILALRKLRQEDCCELEAGLGYIVKFCLKKENSKIRQRN